MFFHGFRADDVPVYICLAGIYIVLLAIYLWLVVGNTTDTKPFDESKDKV